MIVINEAKARKLIVHFHAKESIISPDYLECDSLISVPLAHVLLSRIIEAPGEFIFNHQVSLALNPVRMLMKAYFEGQKNLQELSEAIMKVLSSSEKNISEGQVYVVDFDQVVLDGIECKALGIFKIDRKQPFIESDVSLRGMKMTLNEGVGKRDFNKGALILLPSDQEEMVLKVFQNHPDIKYWKNEFLDIRPLENEFYQTKNTLDLYKDFALKGPTVLGKIDQMDLLNSTVDYFGNNNEYNQAEFEDEVLASSEIKQAFQVYKEDFEKKHGMAEISDQFAISKPAFKAAKKYIRSVIKLDRNFHVYVHGQRQEIERGYDEVRGKNFYKLYFDEES